MSFRSPCRPSRDRPEDIEALAEHFLRRFEPRALPLLPETVRFLHALPWFGNVRELRNALEHAAIVARGGQLLPEHFPIFTADLSCSSPAEQVAAMVRKWLADAFGPAARTPPSDLYAELLRCVEPALLDDVMRRVQGNRWIARNGWDSTAPPCARSWRCTICIKRQRRRTRKRKKTKDQNRQARNASGLPIRPTIFRAEVIRGVHLLPNRLRPQRRRSPIFSMLVSLVIARKSPCSRKLRRRPSFLDRIIRDTRTSDEETARARPIFLVKPRRGVAEKDCGSRGSNADGKSAGGDPI